MTKLYLDEDVHEDLAIALRLRGYSIKTTKEAGNKGFSDRDQLKFATSEGRVIISFNIADFNKLHIEFIKNEDDHNGIILSQQLPLRTLVKALLKLIANVKPDRFRNNIIWLSDWIE